MLWDDTEGNKKVVIKWVSTDHFQKY